MSQVDRVATAVDGYDAIGMLPDGKLNIVKADDPPFRPVIIDDEGRPADASDSIVYRTVACLGSSDGE